MNRCTRLLLALFFTLVLPINGMAQSLMQTGSSIPSEAPALKHDMHSMMSADEMHGAMAACDDHESNGVVCDSGQECKTSGLLQLHVAKSHALPPGQPPLMLSASFVPLPLPEPLWHPPRS
ncbi:hypothetical protein SAMN05216421_1723 [Halopseudomonas xinjiangensis]|uniref:Uncharacterized protein n=1 Tax=Halopseudomonas xinjiangensis TaxID=487184 RepID=A0A1H1T3E9_9GAMM|nr:hypothetical protein [Halopseudomonas xinjiangensis]SDS54643.1 hypothetical protein SAMN05216421_1723 [Halopseudomonas xinjiangensis]